MNAGKYGRYLWLLLLSAVVGGVTALFGGWDAVIRGAIMGVSLSIPIPRSSIFSWWRKDAMRRGKRR
ncbi:MAG: hypothetical protein PHQ27_06680 [Victivallales bacterium]|nr:hypothetical protein [Victivallales bacterium]